MKEAPQNTITRPYPLPPLPANRYYTEPLSPAAIGKGMMVFVEGIDPFDTNTYRLVRVIHKGQTAYHDVLIAETYNYGRALMLNRTIQSAEEDQALYHEMLVQPAMLCHPDPRDVLIIGGGEGATLREVLVHRSVRSATMVDLDREVVELCREHLLAWHRGAFDDARARVLFADGRNFVENDDARYDVVIIDVVDMLDNGPTQTLCTRQFFEHLRRRLRPNAVVVVQGLEFSFICDKFHAALARTLRAVFPEVHSYSVHIPSFLCSWGFLIASDWFRPNEWPARNIDSSIENRLGLQWLTHLTGDFVGSCFCLCKETQFRLSLPGPIFEDGEAFILPPDIKKAPVSVARFPT